MPEVNRLVEASTGKLDRLARPKHPKGWEPGAVVGEDDGFIVANPRVLEPGEVARPEMEPWEDHLRQAGINPDLVRVIPPVEVRTWDAMVKNDLLAQSGRDPDDIDPQDLMVVRKMVYFKARLERRRGSESDPELRTWIRKWKPKKQARNLDSGLTVVVPWSDWQVGKTSSKEGTPETYQRIVDGFDRTVDYVRQHKPSRIIVAALGDMIENCAGFYPQQTYSVDLSLTEQEYLVQTLLVKGLKLFSDLADEVLVLPVGGNHGENRADGKSFTDFADNFDVSVFRHVRDILQENERFAHVGFHIPRADLTQTLDVHGWILGLLHGHQATAGAHPKRIDDWWKAQMKARAPIGDADILLNGHYHHFLARSVGPRFHIQVPSMDMGSEWWDDTKGGREPSGQVVFTVSDDGWDNLRVL